MVKLEGIKINKAFIKVELLIYQHKVQKNGVEQWEFYNAQIIKIMNETFSNYQKGEDLYKLQLTTYAQVFPNFVLLLFVAPFQARMSSRIRFGAVNMGGTKEGTRTMMEADSIVVEVVIEST
jgi:hypothetical protein